MAGKRDKNDHLLREVEARVLREQNAAPKPGPPVTEASVALAAALEDAGRSDLAVRARQLEWDENYSDSTWPINDLVAVLMIADLPDLMSRANAGEFDATAADTEAYLNTAKGRAEKAEFEQLMQDNTELASMLDSMLKRIGGDEQALERIKKSAQGRMMMDLGLIEPAPDDDVRCDPDDLDPRVAPLVGVTDPVTGARLDTPEILACAEVVVRGGGRDFMLFADESNRWTARVTFATAEGPYLVSTGRMSGPNAAARDLVGRTIVGSRCLECQRVISLNPRGFLAQDRRMADGRMWTAVEQAEAGMCLWRRRGPHWYKGCEPVPGE